jgi:hypothetical protein
MKASLLTEEETMARVLSESDTVLAGFIEVLGTMKKRRVGLLRR